MASDTNSETQAGARPECFEFAMDFLGGSEADQVRAYVESLEAALAASSPTPGGRDGDREVWRYSVVSALEYLRAGDAENAIGMLDSALAVDELAAATRPSTAPAAETWAEPAPNWCRTCGKRPNDPLAALCFDPFHTPTQDAAHGGRHAD